MSCAVDHETSEEIAALRGGRRPLLFDDEAQDSISREYAVDVRFEALCEGSLCRIFSAIMSIGSVRSISRREASKSEEARVITV